MSLTNAASQIKPQTSLHSWQYDANHTLSNSTADNTSFFLYRCLFDELLRQPARLIEPEQQAPASSLKGSYAQPNLYYSSTDHALYDTLASAIQDSDPTSARWLLAAHPEPLALREERLANAVIENMSWPSRQRFAESLTIDESTQPVKLYDVLQSLQPHGQREQGTAA